MATRSTTKKAPTKTSARSTRSSSAVSVKKTPSRSTKKTEMVSEEPMVTSSKMAMPALPISRKTTYIILLALGVVILLFAANKYLVVAWVDKKPVSAFEYYSTLSKRYGKDINEELITQKLLENEASNKGIKISDTELNDEIKKIEDQQGGADKLNQILQAQNISQDEFHHLVRLQLLRTKLFADVAMVNESDVDAYIAENKEAFAPSTDASTGATIDPKEDPKLRESIKEQLAQQKTNASFSAWLQIARQSSRVVTNWQ